MITERPTITIKKAGLRPAFFSIVIVPAVIICIDTSLCLCIITLLFMRFSLTPPKKIRRKESGK